MSPSPGLPVYRPSVPSVLICKYVGTVLSLLSRWVIDTCNHNTHPRFWSLVLMVLLELGFTIIICQSLQAVKTSSSLVQGREFSGLELHGFRRLRSWDSSQMGWFGLESTEAWKLDCIRLWLQHFLSQSKQNRSCNSSISSSSGSSRSRSRSSSSSRGSGGSSGDAY